MSPEFKLPLYVKASLLFVGLLALIGLLYLLESTLVPIIYAIIFAIVLSPVVNYLSKKNINRTFAITLTILFSIAFSITVLILLSSQFSKFTESFPLLLKKLDALLFETVAWISDNFNVSSQEINLWIKDNTKELLNGSRELIGETLVNIGNLLVVLVLVPVYMFMILYYQPRLLSFVHQLFNLKKQQAVDEVLAVSKGIIQSYLVGLFLEVIIVAILNIVSLLIIGVDYAILLGIVGAILNIIPYLGGIVAVSLTMLIALATLSPLYALFVLIAFIVVQFIDNNYIMPMVVASKVQINALISIIIVIAGGVLWGINGMFLSIPITAIIKVVFDHSTGLKAWGYLLGDAEVTKKYSH